MGNGRFFRQFDGLLLLISPIFTLKEGAFYVKRSLYRFDLKFGRVINF